MTPALDLSGCRIIDQDVEDEASWLESAILIPDPAALHIVSNGMDDLTASRVYGVSIKMLRYRIDMSGARIRMSRRRGNLGHGTN
jgi:hypothetical protein